MEAKKKESPLKVIGAALVIVIGGVSVLDGGLTKLGMAGINKQVTDDVIEQYEIAKRGGDAMQICAQAGLVTAAYLQAKDEEQYRRWKAIEKADCAKAGVPQF